MTPDPPAFTHATNLPSDPDVGFLAEAGQETSIRSYLKQVRSLRGTTEPRRPYIVPLTVEVKAHSPEHARQIAAYCAKDGFGARARIEVGEPRES